MKRVTGSRTAEPSRRCRLGDRAPRTGERNVRRREPPGRGRAGDRPVVPALVPRLMALGAFGGLCSSGSWSISPPRTRSRWSGQEWSRSDWPTCCRGWSHRTTAPGCHRPSRCSLWASAALVVERAGLRSLLGGGAVVAAVGLGRIVPSPTPDVALAGCFVVGFGLACVFPLLGRAAAQGGARHSVLVSGPGRASGSPRARR